MKSIFDECYIDVNDVAVFENLIVTRDAVADHVINAGTDGFWETPVVERGRNSLLFVDSEFVTDSVQFPCTDSRSDKLLYHFELFCREGANRTHLFDFICGFELNSHVLLRAPKFGSLLYQNPISSESVELQELREEFSVFDEFVGF